MPPGSVGAETLFTDSWVGSVLNVAGLTGLLQGGVHEHPAPLNQPYPYVTWQVYGNPTVVRGVGPDARIFVRADYLVRATTQGLPSTLKTPMRKVHELLEGGTADLADGTILSCVGTEDFRLDEILDGETVWHVGGIFTVEAQTF